MKMKVNEEALKGAKLPVQEATAPKEQPSKIVTVVEAIHNGLTRNFTYYPADKLEQSVESWNAPYNKPVIRNHNVAVEPTGRVMQAEFAKSIVNPELFTIKLHLEITDPDTITKVLDGRYQTLSIGGETESCTCSICGKDILKEGFCGHWKGRTYEGKQAHWSVGVMSFDEISWVNVPADGNAQVIVRDATAKSKANKESVEGRTTTVPGINGDILDSVDSLTEEVEGETPTGSAQVEGETPAETPAVPAAPEETPVAKTAEELQVELDAANKARQAAEARVAEVEAENTTLKAEKGGLEKRAEELDAENKQQLAQNVELAKSLKRTMAESVVNMRILLGKDKEEDRESLVTEHAKSSAKLLVKTIDELRVEKIARETVQVPSPGLAGVNQPHAETEGDTQTEGANSEPTLETFENVLIEAFTRRN